MQAAAQPLRTMQLAPRIVTVQGIACSRRSKPYSARGRATTVAACIAEWFLGPRGKPSPADPGSRLDSATKAGWNDRREERPGCLLTRASRPRHVSEAALMFGPPVRCKASRPWSSGPMHGWGQRRSGGRSCLAQGRPKWRDRQTYTCDVCICRLRYS